MQNRPLKERFDMALQIEHYNFSPVDISPCGTHYIMVKTDTDAGEWVRWKDVASYIKGSRPTVRPKRAVHSRRNVALRRI